MPSESDLVKLLKARLNPNGDAPVNQMETHSRALISMTVAEVRALSKQFLDHPLSPEKHRSVRNLPDEMTVYLEALDVQGIMEGLEPYLIKVVDDESGEEIIEKRLRPFPNTKQDKVSLAPSEQ